MRFFKRALELIFCLVICSSFTLSNRLFEAKPGSYIITKQNEHYSLLLLREKNKDSLLFEEVSIPSYKVDPSSMRWDSWMEEGAPGHSSWIQYEIDPATLQLTECYSFSKQGWVYLDESDHFLSKLLALELVKTPAEQRRKIGPPPGKEELDRRPVWNPSSFIQGKKTKCLCDVWKTTWPKDHSLLSGCELTLYLPPQEISPFPLWLEANNGHFSYSIQAISFGKDLTSPIVSLMPRRPPQILKSSKKTDTSLLLFIKAPFYYKELTLFAFDILEPKKQIGPIPFALTREENTEGALLEIPLAKLEFLLQKNHRYKWLLCTKTPASFVVESEDLFLWNCGKQATYEQKKTSQIQP
jgi:hypothetical protein